MNELNVEKQPISIEFFIIIILVRKIFCIYIETHCIKRNLNFLLSLSIQSSIQYIQFWGAEKETQQRLETAIFEDLNRYCWSTTTTSATTNGSVTDTINTTADNNNSTANITNNNSSSTLGPPLINNAADGQVKYQKKKLLFMMKMKNKKKER